MLDVIPMLQRALETQPPDGVVSVYAFGSRVSGRAHRDSDVDLGVWLDRAIYPDRRERFEARLRLIVLLGRALGRNDVDLVVLNDVPPHLARAIVTRGTRVYTRDADADRAIVRDVQLRAADVEPFLRRTRQVKLAAILR